MRQVSQKHMHFLPAFFCLISFPQADPSTFCRVALLRLHTFPPPTCSSYRQQLLYICYLSFMFTHFRLIHHSPLDSQRAQPISFPHNVLPSSPPSHHPQAIPAAQRSAQVVPRQQRRDDELAQKVTSALRAREGVQRLELALHVLVGLCVCVGVVCVGCGSEIVLRGRIGIIYRAQLFTFRYIQK